MKAIRIIFCILFFALCAIPAVTMPFSEQDTSFERRTESEMPSLITDGNLNTDYGAELESYISEHFGLRAELVTLNSWLYGSIFGVSTQESVIVGSDDWLFLSETLADYSGDSLLSAREIHNIARTIELVSQYADSKGAELVFTVAPNKNTLYNDNMPYWYIKSDESNLKALATELQSMDINYLDLYSLLGDSDEIYYHKRDTHWNNKGAFIATNALLESIGFEPISCDFEWEERRDYVGDLEGMIYPTGSYKDIQLFPSDLSLTDSFSYSGRASGVESQDFTTISTKNNDGSILMLRDSFGNAIAPFLSSQVGMVRYQKYMPYQMSLLENKDYDAVIIEIVQRNLPLLLEEAPDMPAMAVTLTGNAHTITEPSYTMEVQQDSDSITIAGEVDRGLLSDNSDIYIMAVSDGTYIFGAFPIGESGYSVQLKSDSISKDSAFSLVIKTGDELNILTTSH